MKLKKAVIFDLRCNNKKRRYLELFSGSHALINKHGAMFGLDARIALAIFGALSVISGAALYSAIQQSKVVSTIAVLNELGKAYEAYYLDTGEKLAPQAFNFYLNTEELTTSSKTGWNGPYVSYQTVSTSESAFRLVYKPGKTITMQYLLDGVWTKGVDVYTEARCDTGTVGGNCTLWISMDGYANELSLVDAIDTYVDGTVNYKEGNFRVDRSAGGNYYIRLKYAPYN